jgi:hypothetical protein
MNCWTLLATTSPSGGSNPAETPGSTTWSNSSAWQRPTTHCKRDESGHSGTRLGDSTTSALLSGPCSIGLSPLPLSLQQSALFPSTTSLSSKTGSTSSSRPNGRISSDVGSKICPNVGRQSWIMEENT